MKVMYQSSNSPVNNNSMLAQEDKESRNRTDQEFLRQNQSLR
jgi:hypothetical protein